MKEILEKVQQIQRDLLGKKTVYVDVHAFESSLNIHVAVFADNNDSDDMKSFDFHSDFEREKLDRLMFKLEAYVEYANKI